MDPLTSVLRKCGHKVSSNEDYLSWLTEILEKIPEEACASHNGCQDDVLNEPYQPVPFVFPIFEESKDFGPAWLRAYGSIIFYAHRLIHSNM